MKCNDTGKLIIDKLAGELSQRQANKLDKHLASCEACRKESEMLSKAWQASNETLKEDTFAKELTPNRRAEIFAVAQHEEKRKRSSRVITRVVEYFAVVMICIILAGMMLPALNVSRERARRISCATTKKQVGLGVAMKAPQSTKDKFDTDEDEGSVRSTLATAEESRKKYRPRSQSYMDRIRGKIAGVTNTLGGAPALEKTSKRKAVGNSISLSEAPAPKTWHKDISATTAAKNNEWHVKAPKGVAIKEFSAPKAYKKRIYKSICREAPAPCMNSIQADVSKKLPVLIKDKNERIGATSQSLVSSRSLDYSKDSFKGNLKSFTAIKRKIAIKMRRGEQPGKQDIKEMQQKIEEIKELNCVIIKPEPIIINPPLDFKLDLKLWNMTTVKNVKAYFKENGYPVPRIIKVNKRTSKILIVVPESQKQKFKELFKKLQDEEKELKDLSKGLPFIKCLSRPVSTFSIDTDTASYIQARKSIRRGERPDPLKIRPEEFINYFDYNYRSPVNTTFAVYPEAAPSPFRPNNTLFRVGIQGKRLGPDANTRTHYTILLDTSGSMAVKDRMELAKKALTMMLKKLKSSDYISLLLCGNETKVVFRMRSLDYENRQKLLRILNGVTPRSVADFANGISQAYAFADRYYLRNSANRIIIISDGIFELNDAGRRNITTQIEAARKRGISNIVIGLGGDGDDNMLEKVASTGDGSYVFLDTEREAKELFTTQFEARFREIARDVKIQVQFNPLAVKSYRQIGYKNRQLSKADFRNDKVDAGEVGSGQSVTALYELKLNDNIPKDTVVATVRIRYKKAGDMRVEEKAFSLYESDVKDKFKSASPNFKLSAFVAEFAESLRYPETQGIASLRGVADQLNGTWMKHYRKDYKVTELLSLIKRSR